MLLNSTNLQTYSIVREVYLLRMSKRFQTLFTSNVFI